MKKRNKKHKPQLSDTEKLAIHAIASGRSQVQTASICGVSTHTVRTIQRDTRYRAKDREIEVIKSALSGRLYQTADRAITQVGDTIDGASAYQAMLIAGIAIDKARLIEGQSNVNVSAHVWSEMMCDVPVDVPPRYRR